MKTHIMLYRSISHCVNSPDWLKMHRECLGPVREGFIFFMPHLEQEGSRGSIDLIRAQGLKLSPPPSTCYPLAVKREVSCCRVLMTSWLYINTLAKRQRRENAFLTTASNSKTGAAKGQVQMHLVSKTSCSFQTCLNSFYSVCKTHKHLEMRLYKINLSLDRETQQLYHRLRLYFV